MKNIIHPIERRTFLRGLGTAMALPFMESALPRSLWAGRQRAGEGAAADGVFVHPERRPHAGVDAGDRGRRLRTAGDARTARRRSRQS